MTTRANIDRFTGFAEGYDAVRPAPPPVVVDVLTELAGAPRPRRVVDLGSGTGLSTRLWAGRADEVIGVEPNDDMRGAAEARTDDPAIGYRKGTSDATGLEAGSADVVTCVQSLHWMPPEETFAEVARVLRDGGVFAALDCDWPPLVHWQLHDRWARIHEDAERAIRDRGLAEGLVHQPKASHLERMRESGRFRFVEALAFHRRDTGDAKRLVALARSQGGVATLLKVGDPRIAAALADLEAEAERLIGTDPVPWTYTYRARVAVK